MRLGDAAAGAWLAEAYAHRTAFEADLDEDPGWADLLARYERGERG